jgi:hypothetical protein
VNAWLAPLAAGTVRPDDARAVVPLRRRRLRAVRDRARQTDLLRIAVLLAALPLGCASC